MIKYDVIIIGGGAAGLLAAGVCAKQGKRVLLIEKNKILGKKLLITGKGRCNVTNNCNIETFISSVPANARFLYSAISKLTPKDTIDFFENLGLRLKTERGNRVFPESDRSHDVVNTLVKYVKDNNCEIINETVKKLIINEEKEIEGVITGENRKYYSKSVILATGGKSYPATGSTGDGFIFAKKVGHTIIELKPSLVPLVSKETWCKEIQGLSLRNIKIYVKDNDSGKIIYEDFGEMIFTHFGISGPVILSASSHMRKMKDNKYSVIIDLKPALTEKQLDLRIQRDFKENLNKNFSNALNKLLPSSIIPVIISLCLINENTKINQITKSKRRNLVKTIKNLQINIKSFRPIEEAIITSGGINIKEIEPKTMQSKLIKGLFFAGEIIDVDAYTGGFNLQIAFSTAYTAAQSC